MRAVKKRRQPLRVLCVENDQADIELNTIELTRSGFNVQLSTACTAVEFENHLATAEFDVILADYRMPGWTGMDALKFVKEKGLGIPVILITGTLGDELAAACVRFGAADYLIKDNLGRLGTAVRRALRDVKTAARIAECDQAIRQSERRFQQLAENIDEVFFVTTADLSEILYVNPAYERIWGHSCASLYASPASFFDQIPEGDRHSFLHGLAAVQQGQERGETEFKLKKSNGELRIILARYHSVRDDDGRVYRIAGVARDITDAQQSDEALRENAAFFRKMLETSFDGFVITENGVIADLNTGYAETFGYTVDELRGHRVTDLIAPASMELYRERITSEGTYQVVGITKDGRELTCEVTARKHVVGGRKLRLAAVRDLTEKRLLEEQFHQAQKMEAVGRLAAGVAHDFNNLLTVITGCSELLLEDVPEESPLREEVDHISKAAGDAAALTRQLLAFSRQQVVQPRMIALEPVIAKTEKLLGRLIGEDIKLETQLQHPASTVCVDPAQLEQVVLNLAVNARDAMPNGGRLTLQSFSKTIHESDSRVAIDLPAGSYVVLSVRDTGIGMNEATQERIFEPFFTTKAVGTGTGLGLATVYAIVKQAGGNIVVESQVGTGTTVSIYLPRFEAVVEAEETAPIKAAGGNETILIAEDSATVRTVLRRALERNGYTVHEAATGAFALTLVGKTKHAIDLLITDLVMPEMNGRELVRRFHAIAPNTKVIYMSGYDRDVATQKGMMDADTVFLQKPFGLNDLVHTIRGVLDSSECPSTGTVPSVI